MIQVIFQCGSIRKHMCKEGLEIFFKPLRQGGAPFFTQLDQPFFAGMGLPVQGEQKIKICFQERADTMIDTDTIPTFCGLHDLQFVCRHSLTKQFHTAIQNVSAQLFRVGN